MDSMNVAAETVGELVDLLSAFESGAPLRMAGRPEAPVSYDVGAVLGAPATGASGTGVVWITEGGQLGSVPSTVADALGWPVARLTSDDLWPEPYDVERRADEQPQAPAPESLAVRAQRLADGIDEPSGLESDPVKWVADLQWVRKVRRVAALAVFLRVPLDWIAIREDPNRTATCGGGPDDVFVVTEPNGVTSIEFVSNHPLPGGDGWIQVVSCSDCPANIPVLRVDSLADLSEAFDPETGTVWWDGPTFLLSPWHTPDCCYGPADT